MLTFRAPWAAPRGGRDASAHARRRSRSDVGGSAVLGAIVVSARRPAMRAVEAAAPRQLIQRDRVPAAAGLRERQRSSDASSARGRSARGPWRCVRRMSARLRAVVASPPAVASRMTRHCNRTLLSQRLHRLCWGWGGLRPSAMRQRHRAVGLGDVHLLAGRMIAAATATSRPRYRHRLQTGMSRIGRCVRGSRVVSVIGCVRLLDAVSQCPVCVVLLRRSRRAAHGLRG